MSTEERTSSGWLVPKPWPIECPSCGHQEGVVRRVEFKNGKGHHRRLECAACGKYIRFLPRTAAGPGQES